MLHVLIFHNLLASHHLKKYSYATDSKILQFTHPGKPAQNAYIERFNRSYREAVLNMYLFRSSEETQSITNKWINHYNEERPHESLNNQSPRSFINNLNQNYSSCKVG